MSHTIESNGNYLIFCQWSDQIAGFLEDDATIFTAMEARIFQFSQFLLAIVSFGVRLSLKI